MDFCLTRREGGNMGYYVPMDKAQETSEFVEYLYGHDQRTRGILRLDKLNGEVSDVRPLLHPDAPNYFIRAKMRARKLWHERQYPEQTCWA